MAQVADMAIGPTNPAAAGLEGMPVPEVKVETLDLIPTTLITTPPELLERAGVLRELTAGAVRREVA